MPSDMTPVERTLVTRLASSTEPDVVRVVALLKARIEKCSALARELEAMAARVATLQAGTKLRKKRSAAPYGRPAYGTQRGQRQGVREIVRLRGQNASLREIARHLNETGVLSATGGKWTAQSISNVLHREEQRRRSQQTLFDCE
jgi:hypothetical protein